MAVYEVSWHGPKVVHRFTGIRKWVLKWCRWRPFWFSKKISLTPLMVSAFDLISQSAMLEGRWGWKAEVQFCFSCACSTGHLLSTSGRMQREPSTPSLKEGGGEQGDALMPLLFSFGQHSSQKLSEPSWEMANICSLSWMTSTQPRCQIMSALCMLVWVMSWGRERTSTSMEARRKCGIKLACDLPSAMTWNALLERTTPGHVCGAGLMCPLSNKASRFWEFLLVTTISFVNIWAMCTRNTSDSWPGSLSLQMCSLFGSFWCIARKPGQFPDQSSQTRSSWRVCNEPWQRFVVVSGPDSGDWIRAVRRRDARCCDTSFGVGRFGAQKRCTHQPVSFLDQLGGMPSQWWARATQKLLLCWFVIWKATHTLPVWQWLSTRQGHCQGFWASNLLLGVHSYLVPDLRHGHRTHSNQARSDKVARRLVTHRRVFPECVVHQVAWQHQSFGEGPRWARGGTGVDHVPNVSGDTSGASIVSRALAPPPSAASPSHCALLPVWPTIRLLWSPPRSLRTSRGAWKTRLGFGECGCQGVPRGGRPGHDQRDVTRLRHGFAWVADGRRLEVVADGLPLFGGAQLAIDTTLVCALRRDGNPTSHAAEEDGAALRRARQWKERTYLELVGRRARARLVILVVEVGGRWSEEARNLLSQLAIARARGEILLLRKRAEQAWRLRWGSMLSCTAARAVAAGLLELSGARGADGATPPPHEVEQDFRFAGLAKRVWLLVSVAAIVCRFSEPWVFFSVFFFEEKKKKKGFWGFPWWIWLSRFRKLDFFLDTNYNCLLKKAVRWLSIANNILHFLSTFFCHLILDHGVSYIISVSDAKIHIP